MHRRASDLYDAACSLAAAQEPAPDSLEFVTDPELANVIRIGAKAEQARRNEADAKRVKAAA